jgi:hypothetical protein
VHFLAEVGVALTTIEYVCNSAEQFHRPHRGEFMLGQALSV